LVAVAGIGSSRADLGVLNMPEPSHLPISVSSAEACAYLGVCVTTLLKYVKKGILPAFKLHNKSVFGENPLRFRLADLDRLLVPLPIRQRHLIDPEKVPEIPIVLVTRILGLTASFTKRHIWLGDLKGRRPEDIREFLLKEGEKRAVREARRKARLEYGNRLHRVTQMLCKARRKLQKLQEMEDAKKSS